MIGLLDGKLIEKEPTHVILSCAGVGYLVHISLNTFGALKDEAVRLHTHLSVKEDSLTLFGFVTKEERELFLELIGISGVGPSTALMVLSSLPPQELHQVIINGNLPALQRVKGIGAKTAQRILLELGEVRRKKGLLGDSHTSSTRPSNSLRDEALTALVTLGLPRAAAEKSVDKLLSQTTPPDNLEVLLREALRNA